MNRLSENWKFVSAFAVLLWVFSSVSIAATTEKCFLWEVSSKSTKVYLMGSIHMFKPNMYPLNDCMLDAYNKSDILVVELNMAAVDMEKMNDMMLQKGMYSDGKTLENSLSSITLNKLKAYLKSQGAELFQVNKMRPWFLGITIAVQEMMKLGFDQNLGVDMHFINKATGNKKILELETIEEQMEVLTGDSEKIQDLSLLAALEDIPMLDQLMDRMVDAWMMGDAMAMDIIMRESTVKYPRLKEQLKRTLDDRNIKMAAKIEGYLKTKETYFIVVGGGHMAGKTGIVTLLKKRKYQVKQLDKVNNHIALSGGLH